MFSVNQTRNDSDQFPKRRQRLHELLIALIQQQESLELMDTESPNFKTVPNSSHDLDHAKWINHNQRILKKYQSLVRSAVAIDALLESEQNEL